MNLMQHVRLYLILLPHQAEEGCHLLGNSFQEPVFPGILMLIQESVSSLAGHLAAA